VSHRKARRVVNVDGMREKTFNIRFSEEEWERLDRLSAAHGLNAASLIRMLLKHADTASDREKATFTARAVDKVMAPARQLEKAAAPITKTQKQIKAAMPKIPKPKR
jgi:predicted DNA-binding protein